VDDFSSEPVKRRAPTRSRPAFRKPPLNVSQGELFPLSLDELVDADDPCRLVVKLVGLLDLSSLESRLSLNGAPSYPLRIMLALEMFSKWDSEFGSRRVEKRCKHDNRYRWICQGLQPDHTTIWRFRRFLGSDMDELLAESVRLGHRMGLQSMGRVSIDGTKIPAAASQWRALRKISEEADEGEVQTEPPEPPEGGDSSEALKRIENSKKKPPKGERLPSKDPDAKTVRSGKGHFIVGYNAQVIVDRDTSLVMSLHTTSQASDSALLEPTLSKYLDAYGVLPCDLLADAGYNTPRNACALEELGIDAVIACPERTPFWRLDARGEVLCPMGHIAPLKDRFTKNGVKVVRYVVAECPECPLKKKCLAKETSLHKTVSVEAGLDIAAWIRLKHLARSDQGKERLQERGKTIEFVFARLKERFGFERLSMWKLEGAHTEIGLFALAMNLAVIARTGLHLAFEVLYAIYSIALAPDTESSSLKPK